MALSIIPMLLQELDQEAGTTRKMLARIPNDKYDWQPHPKSMTVKRLAAHIDELPGWISMTLNTTELDFANNPYTEQAVDNTTDVLAYFEKMYAEGRARLEKANVDELEETWTLRNGEQIYTTGSKYDFIRTTFAQMIHHRAQLGVFLRLLDVSIPGSYGPSADDMDF